MELMSRPSKEKGGGVVKHVSTQHGAAIGKDVPISLVNAYKSEGTFRAFSLSVSFWNNVVCSIALMKSLGTSEARHLSVVENVQKAYCGAWVNIDAVASAIQRGLRIMHNVRSSEKERILLHPRDKQQDPLTPFSAIETDVGPKPFQRPLLISLSFSSPVLSSMIVVLTVDIRFALKLKSQTMNHGM